MQMNGCGCIPPKPSKNDCCCKDGILCVIDWLYKDFLVKPTGGNCIESGTLKYYPVLKKAGGSDENIPNVIYNIPYPTPDVLPIYIKESEEPPYDGNKTFLSVCKINAFEFKFKSEACEIQKDREINTLFSKIKCVSPKSCCCTNGLVEYLFRARDFLDQNIDAHVVLSTEKESFRGNKFVAINSETVWLKNTEATPSTYYVVSLCELVGITQKIEPFPAG